MTTGRNRAASCPLGVRYGLQKLFGSEELDTIVEQLAEAAYLAIDGWVADSFGPSGLTAPLVASFVFCPTMPEFTAGEYWACPARGNVQGVECNSDRHQIALQRR